MSDVDKYLLCVYITVDSVYFTSILVLDVVLDQIDKNSRVCFQFDDFDSYC